MAHLSPTPHDTHMDNITTEQIERIRRAAALRVAEVQILAAKLEMQQVGTDYDRNIRQRAADELRALVS
jgi:hypothetical protein